MANEPKLRIGLISRKPGRFNSIERVFTSLLPSMSTSAEIHQRKLPFGSGFWGILLNLLFFRPGKADVFHITGECHYISLKLPAEKTVLTIHDLGFLERRKGLRGYVIRKLFFEWPVEKTRWITAVSDATKAHIEREFPSVAGKVRVIPNPVTISPSDAISREPSVEGHRRILQVGTEPHKNLKAVIAALAGSDHQLLILGRLGGEERALLDTSGVAFKNEEFLSDEELSEAYLSSDALVFCSLFEGFGLPILEAQRLGVPVITSDIAVLRETAGDGALFADPNDPVDIRRKVESIFCDGNLRAEIRDKAIRNIARFSPELISQRYEDIYREVTGRGAEN